MRARLAVLAACALLVPLSGCLEGVDIGASAGGARSKGKGTGVADIPDPPVEETTVTMPAPRRLPHFPSDGASVVIDLEVPSFDGHVIPLTVHKPTIASAAQQVPVLLHSHGFTGSRSSALDSFKPLIAAGFGVVSFDERGHGESKDDSEVYFMHPEYEVKDVLRVIDEVAKLDWALMEAPGDPVLGAIGGSYGGAYQLMGAIFDPRLDAMVPEIAWNDITEALAPNGAIKSGWVDLFYVAGNAQQSVVFSDDFHAGFAYATASNNFPAGQAPGVPDLHTRLKEASPASYPGRITIPTLLIQGMPDTLFPLNQAVANFRMLEDAGLGENVSLYTHLGGHLLSVNSLRPGTTPVPVGLQGQPGGKPCGNLTALQTMWHQKHLLGIDGGDWPRVCIALEDETTVAGRTFPLPGTTVRTFDLAGPTPVVQAPAGPGVQLPLFTASEDTVVAGIPTLTGTIAAPGADTIVYFSLRVPSRADPLEQIVNDQVVPLRVAGPNTAAKAFSVDLGGVGVRLKAGEQLVLTVSTVEPMYFGNAERVPGGTVLQGMTVSLPIVPAATPAFQLPA